MLLAVNKTTDWPDLAPGTKVQRRGISGVKNMIIVKKNQ
jgi:hypothetical protein